MKQFLPNNFLAGVMERRFEERSAENAITYLAVQTLIQGKQKKQKLVEALKEAVAELKDTNPNF
eukprot:4630942-Ditylum_brightwellii.AAC.1